MMNIVGIGGNSNSFIIKRNRRTCKMQTKTVVIEKPKQPKRLVLKLQREPTKSTRKRPKFIFSWDGLEKQKEEVIQLARLILEYQKELEKVAHQIGETVLSLWSKAIRDPSSVSYCT